MNELMECITNGNKALPSDKQLVFSFVSESHCPYQLNHTAFTPKGGDYSHLYLCLEGVKEYFISLNNEPRIEELTDLLKYVSADRDKLNDIANRQTHEIRLRLRDIKDLSEERGEFERKLEESVGREEAFLEYNHQLIADKKRLYKKIHELELRLLI